VVQARGSGFADTFAPLAARVYELSAGVSP